jgi:hypothetical protein
MIQSPSQRLLENRTRTANRPPTSYVSILRLRSKKSLRAIIQLQGRTHHDNPIQTTTEYIIETPPDLSISRQNALDVHAGFGHPLATDDRSCPWLNTASRESKHPANARDKSAQLEGNTHSKHPSCRLERADRTIASQISGDRNSLCCMWLGTDPPAYAPSIAQPKRKRPASIRNRPP